MDVIKKNIAEGSIIYTDWWEVYKLDELQYGSLNILLSATNIISYIPTMGCHTQSHSPSYVWEEILLNGAINAIEAYFDSTLILICLILRGGIYIKKWIFLCNVGRDKKIISFLISVIFSFFKECNNKI